MIRAMNNDDRRRRAFAVAEVGEMFALSTDTIKRHLKKGLIRGIRVGGRILIPAAEVDRLEREGAVIGKLERKGGRHEQTASDETTRV